MKHHLQQIATGSLETLQKSVNDPAAQKDILNSAFESALLGIRTGVMKYENDPLLPILQREMEARIAHF